MSELLFFGGLALVGWGWAFLDGAFQRDMASTKPGEGKWIVLGVLGLCLMMIGAGLTLTGLVNWLYAHLRII